jgi:hypothetical protein
LKRTSKEESKGHEMAKREQKEGKERGKVLCGSFGVI